MIIQQHMGFSMIVQSAYHLKVKNVILHKVELGKIKAYKEPNHHPKDNLFY
jgi:hypothetical protein